MARVPGLERTVRADPLPGQDFRAADQTAGLRLVGQAAEHLGQAGSDYADVEQQIRLHEAQTVARDQANYATQQKTDLLYGENGFFNLKGKAAVDAYPNVMKQLDDIDTGVANGLHQQPIARRMFIDNAAERKTTLYPRLVEHRMQQFDAYSDQVDKDGLGVEQNSIIANAHDPKILEEHIATGEGLVQSLLVRKGLTDPKTVSQKQRAWRSDALSGAIKAVAAEGSATDAQAFLNQYRDRMDPTDVTTLEEALRPKVLREQGIALADHLGGGTSTDPLAPLPSARRKDIYTNVEGLVHRGNIDIYNRPVVHNKDGSISTVRSFSIGTDQGEVLIPQVVNGKLVSKKEAEAHYRRTGEHLGIFRTPAEADAFAQRLHEQQAGLYDRTPDLPPEVVWSRMVGPDGKGGVEGGTNADGSFRTSPKGAVGPAQVMPGTAREAASLAGLPYDEQRYRHDAGYNLALGRAYYNKQLAIFGDPILAAAAYNAGPTRVTEALRKGGSQGWTAHVPAETRKYVAAVGGGAGSSTFSPRNSLGEQLRALDSMDVPWEAKEAARTVLTQRAQTASLIATEQHKSWLNDLELALHDGTAGRGEIAAARHSGQLSDYDEVNRLEGIVEAREKDGADLTNFNMMVGDPHFTFNQYDDGQRKAVEAGVKAMGGTPSAAFQVWQRTGILAKSGAVALRGSLVSTDSRAVREAANIAGNMLRTNPNAFAGVEGQSDIEHAAVAFNHYVFDLGQAPEKAAARVAQENDPKFKEKVKFTEPERQEAMKQLRQNGGAQAITTFRSGTFANPEQREEANQTYHELITDNLARGLDLGSAQVQAGAQLQKVYGVNARGHIVKYAPEAIYPAIGGSHEYIYRDAGRTVKAETGRDPVAINLVPIPGVTDQDFRNGRPARYRLLYSYKSNGQIIVDAVPGQFAADTTEPAKELATARRRSFAQERRHLTERPHITAATQPNYSLPKPDVRGPTYFSPGGNP